MKILHIYGNMQHYDYGLEVLLKRVRNVFAELGVENQDVNLGVVHPPYYDGETTQAIDGIVESIKNADGLVLACTSQLSAPSALMQSFLEYLEHPDYHQTFSEKHCLLITLSQNGGEKSALEYLARVVQLLGGYVVAQMGLQAHHAAGLEDSGVGEFVDKTAEDFYRATHQRRKYVIPQDFGTKDFNNIAAPADIPAGVATGLTGNAAIPAAANGGITSDPLLHAGANHLHSSLTDQQEQEIDEISRLISEKYKGGDLPAPAANEPEFPQKIGGTPVGLPPSLSAPLSPPINLAPATPPAPVEPRLKTARQITQNLPHYFQPQLSSGLQAVIQISITGEEAFEGFLYIHSTECSYSEGAAPAPDIIIMADTAVWMDVLKNKHTAQKAFMIGGLKVRGDFVLLTKFDTLFKLEN